MSSKVLPRKSNIAVPPGAVDALIRKEEEAAREERRALVDEFERQPKWDQPFIAPVGQVVVFVRDPLPTTPDGSKILLPEKSVKHYHTPTGRVLACGPDCKVVKPGDRVIWHSSLMVGTIRYQGKVAMSAKEEQLLGVVTLEHVNPVVEDDEQPGRVIEG